MKPIAVVLAIILGFMAGATGQERCAPRAAVLADFEKQHGEKPFLMLVADQGMIVEILRAPSGTWTLFVLRQDGMLCMAMAGGDSRVARSS